MPTTVPQAYLLEHHSQMRIILLSVLALLTCVRSRSFKGSGWSVDSHGKDCRRADFYVQWTEADDDNNCASLCQKRLHNLTKTINKKPDECQGGSGVCLSPIAMNMNPFTTECVCQTVVHFMRFYHPLKTYPQAISNDDEGLDEDHACSPSNVLQRIHSKSGWGTTGVPPYVDGKEVSCDNQPGNGWCDHDGVYHKGDH